MIVEIANLDRIAVTLRWKRIVATQVQDSEYQLMYAAQTGHLVMTLEESVEHPLQRMRISRKAGSKSQDIEYHS